MRLEQLLKTLNEDDSGKAADKSEVRKHNKRLTDIAKKTFIGGAPRQAPSMPQQAPVSNSTPAPAISQSVKTTKASTKGKTFKFTFKEDKGSYQVRIKKNKEGKLKYNYGYYDRDEMPDISINSDSLTDEGKDKYTEFKKIIKTMEKGNNDAKHTTKD